MSVQHTGSRFLQRTLDCPSAHVQHMAVEYTGGDIVVPMRHPRKVLQSWVSRDKSFHDWDSQWAILMEWPEPYIVVPVDLLGLPPVGKFAKEHKQFTKEDEARYEDLINKYGDWFSEYYGDIHAR